MIATGSACLASTISLGSASNYAVLGIGSFLAGDPAGVIKKSNVVITGNMGIGYGGSLINTAPASIIGDVFQYQGGQYIGPGALNGSLTANSALLNQNYADAMSASTQAAALNATQTFGNIGSATTIVGNGGLNVIQINGNITNSLILSGGANDEFVVNVAGTLNLTGSTVLGLNGGVRAGNVIYNFTSSGQTITTQAGSAVSGTLLAVHDDFQLAGSIMGEIIGGGSIVLMSGAKVLSGGTLPEPSTFALLGLGLLSVVCFGGRRLRSMNSL